MEMKKKNPIGLKPDELQRGSINCLNMEYVRAGRRGKMSLLNIGGDLNETRRQQSLGEKNISLSQAL